MRTLKYFNTEISVKESLLRSIKHVSRSTLNLFLSRYGYEIRQVRFHQDTQEKDAALIGKEVLAGRGMFKCIMEAKKCGMDPNEYGIQILGWEAPTTILEQTISPYIQEHSIVCEIGSGTGRYSGQLPSKIPAGELHLIDSSPQIIGFLQEYFKKNQNVHVHHNDGYVLPFSQNNWLDLIFSYGTFVALELSNFYQYSQEFFRCLKPGGICALEYIDITTQEGWNFMTEIAPDPRYFFYTFHSAEVIDRVFLVNGFEPIRRYQQGKSTYALFKKLLNP